MLAGQEACAIVQREFPCWRIWRGADRMYHAVPRVGPVLLVRGESPIDARDQILRAESFRKVETD
jgi:hypothetical protein